MKNGISMKINLSCPDLIDFLGSNVNLVKI